MVIATTMENNRIRFGDIQSMFPSSCYGAVSELYKSSRRRWSRSRLFYQRCGGMYRVLHGQNVSRVVGWRYSVCEEGRNECPLTQTLPLQQSRPFSIDHSEDQMDLTGDFLSSLTVFTTTSSCSSLSIPRLISLGISFSSPTSCNPSKALIANKLRVSRVRSRLSSVPDLWSDL